ncbi:MULTISPECIES: hypothetical protein [unclassified Nocardia]|uniref:hypothetical protein n=1 Tax=unclassified Nocardia TaxID=2637762 RepID=UPI003449BF3E
MRAVADLIGVETPEIGRKSVRQSQIETATHARVSTDESAELQRDNAELERAESVPMLRPVGHRRSTKMGEVSAQGGSGDRSIAPTPGSMPSRAKTRMRGK